MKKKSRREIELLLDAALTAAEEVERARASLAQAKAKEAETRAAYMAAKVAAGEMYE